MKKLILLVTVSVISISIYAQRESGVVPSKFNILYKGIENPLKILVENHSCESIYVTSNTKLRMTRFCNYVSVPTRLGTANFRVSVIKDKDTILVGNHQFRVHKVPDPAAYVGGKSGGKIARNVFLAANRITARLDGFAFDVAFRIESYSVVIEKDNVSSFKKDFKGNRFPNELRSEIQKIGRGAKIRIENIVAKEPDGSTRELAPIEFKLM